MNGSRASGGRTLALARVSLLALAMAQDSGIQFVDVAARAGITPVIVSGSRAKDYVLEVNGSGVCWFLGYYASSNWYFAA